MLRIEPPRDVYDWLPILLAILWLGALLAMGMTEPIR